MGIKKITKYSILSLFPFLSDLIIYYILINYLGINIYISFCIAFLFGSIIAFLLTPIIFKNKLNFKKFYLKFLLIEILVIFVGEFIILSILLNIFYINYFLSKIIATLIVFIFSFFFKNILLTKK